MSRIEMPKRLVSQIRNRSMARRAPGSAMVAQHREEQARDGWPMSKSIHQRFLAMKRKDI